jgi:suppressor of ftsI
VINAASTAWYHPHPHGSTAQHVFRGVAGMIIVEDDNSRSLALPHDYGVDDIPVILQDRSIDADGQVQWETEPNFGQLGTDMIVNGTMDAYLDVQDRRVRLRLLNASNARLYHVGFSDDRRFLLIAGDAGLLPEPVELERVALGPAERAEIVVECAPGERVVMNTVAGEERIDDGSFSLLELRAAGSLRDSPEIPVRLGGAPAVIPPRGATVRRFKLQGHDAINGLGMDLTRIDEVVPANAVEIWELENSVYSHNFHIHGVEFSLMDRDGAPPRPWETGRKDTVHVPEKSTVRVAVQFSSFTDPRRPYMYHCHILRHEDDGMMGQFLVVPPGTEPSTPRSIPAPTGGHAGHRS